ncbi:DNA polymerase III subunit gamma/tau [Thermohalobacter berrensis]|uniref:DNA-directed DNA polymerase n=2 Tax=Thermohalobacter berrensis TaxID=99594 RepID=A0A419SUG4_9FIRM|nr:DNA polymerase III subunit gamma/tau [Thermohalobacter berrensis]
MAYQAIYRKFRPKTFDEVLGQEHVTTILKNQITSDNIAHAYLFSGTRGTGKTSTAKVFARAVNCLNNSDGNPCNQCEVCKGILNDSIMDIVEMDAASNNSVDDIRELREKVKYPPSKGRFKVYIIDEVHMLSKGAFNALLKTLEEPPEHLLFILATTEPQRLPATILSRCQRFDFKRITIDNIVKNMMEICDELGIEAEERALRLIARNSDGAMRDALSILDQCVSFSDKKITYEYVLSILGTVNNDFIFDITNSIIEKDLDKTLQLIDTIVENGKDITQFIKDLITHFRNLMIAKSSDKLENIIDLSEELLEEIKEQATRINLSSIIRTINILSEAENKSKWSSQPRIILEVAIIKLLKPSSDLSVEGLIERINQLEEKLKGGTISVVKTKKEAKVEKSKDNYQKQTINIEEKAKEKIETKTKKDSSNNTSGNIDINKVSKSWPDILKRIKKDRISIHALLMEGKPTSLENGILTISFDEGFGFHKDAVEKKGNREYIEKVISDYYGIELKIKPVMAGETAPSEKDQDIVNQVIDIFGEDIVEIEE